MNGEIESYNTHKQRAGETRHLLIPAASEFLLYLVVALFLLLLINISAIWDYFNETVIGVQGGFTAILSQNTAILSRLHQLTEGGTPLQFGFWFTFGSIFYAAIWAVRTLFLNFRDDLITAGYVLPSKKSQILVSAVSRRLAFLACLILLAAYLFTAARSAGRLARIFYSAVIPNFQGVRGLIFALVCIFITAVIIHVTLVLMRLIGAMWHYVNPF